MGQRNAKVVPLAIPMVLMRIKDCIVPDDRMMLLDLFEMIDINFSNEEDVEVNTRQMKETNGFSVLLKILKRMVEDADMVYVSIQLFATVKFNTPLVMDLIQYGGLDILDKAAKLHKMNEFIATSIPPLVQILLAVGAPASIEEIEKEAMNLQLCRTCQETLERLRKKAPGESTMVVVPRSSDRISKVLKFMDNFIVSVEVQRAALDAVISFARNADAPKSTHETSLIYLLHLSLQTHPTRNEVVWRVALAYSLVAAFSAERAFEIAQTGAHQLLIHHYAEYKKAKDYLVMQQILWMFGALLLWPASRDVLHKEVESMDFFKATVQDFEAVKLQVQNDPKAKKKDFTDDKIYFLVVPLPIHSFLRETGGEVAKKGKKKAEKAKAFVQRRNFDERPKFGTVQDRVLVAGEVGLLPTGQEDEFGNETPVKPDWEVKLDKMVMK